MAKSRRCLASVLLAALLLQQSWAFPPIFTLVNDITTKVQEEPNATTTDNTTTIQRQAYATTTTPSEPKQTRMWVEQHTDIGHSRTPITPTDSLYAGLATRINPFCEITNRYTIDPNWHTILPSSPVSTADGYVPTPTAQLVVSSATYEEQITRLASKTCVTRSGRAVSNTKHIRTVWQQYITTSGLLTTITIPLSSKAQVLPTMDTKPRVHVLIDDYDQREYLTSVKKQLAKAGTVLPKPTSSAGDWPAEPLCHRKGSSMEVHCSARAHVEIWTIVVHFVELVATTNVAPWKAPIKKDPSKPRPAAVASCASATVAIFHSPLPEPRRLEINPLPRLGQG